MCFFVQNKQIYDHSLEAKEPKVLPTAERFSADLVDTFRLVKLVYILIMKAIFRANKWLGNVFIF